MKVLAAVMIFVSILQAQKIGGVYESTLEGKGFTIKVACSDAGILIKRATKDNLLIESFLCIEVSSWDGSCISVPIKCDKKD